MPKYIAITFSPVQSFIEKSRKLRDLYGASQILSDLTSTIVTHRPEQYHLISPGLLYSQQGMPNRVLLKVDSEIQSSSSEEIIAELQRAFLNRWKNILRMELAKKLEKVGKTHLGIFLGHGGRSRVRHGRSRKS
jgi:CRISPR-associated protein Cmr2